MVGMALIILAISWFGVALRALGRLEDLRWFLWLTLFSFPAGFIAVLAGWFTAEVGRQPWVVYGLLRTRDAVTPSLSAPEVVVSLVCYILVYALIYAFGALYFHRLMRGGITAEAASPAGYGIKPEISH
jgi:cytochrome d ubiquinol oxidase subunit I